MDYQTTATFSELSEDSYDCRKAAQSAVENMIKMLESYGFDRSEIALSLADVIDDQIVLMAGR